MVSCRSMQYTAATVCHPTHPMTHLPSLTFMGPRNGSGIKNDSLRNKEVLQGPIDLRTSECTMCPCANTAEKELACSEGTSGIDVRRHV